MNSSAGKVIMGLIGVIVAYFVLKAVVGTVIGILLSLIPIAVVAGALYVGYRLYSGKALGGGRRTLP